MSSSEAPPPELGTLLDHWARFGDDAEAATAVWSEDTGRAPHGSPGGGISCDGDLALSTLLPLSDPFADGFFDGLEDEAFPLPASSGDKRCAATQGKAPAEDADEHARREARLARNREAAAVSRARRRAAADGLESRCNALEAQNRDLQRTVASLTSENHALRLHILATCPPAAPGSAPAVPPPPPGVALGGVPLAVLPPSALPMPLLKLPLPKLALPSRPAPAPARKAEPASKRKRTTFAAAAALVLVALLGSLAPFDPTPRVSDGARAALPAGPAPPAQVLAPALHANASSEALHLAHALLESARVAALDANASSAELAPFLQLLPPSLPLASDEQDSPMGALVAMFPGAADDDSTALLHTRWLEETWRPLLSLPLSDERAKASLKALSVYATATSGFSGGASDLLGGLRAPWSALQSAWPAVAPPALSCRRLFEFTAAADDFGAPAAGATDAAGAASASATGMPRALRRFGGAWPLPPAASEVAGQRDAASGRRAADVASAADSEVVVSLLQPPAGYTFGGTPTVGGAGASSTQVLVVVLLQSAARYLTFSCSV